MKRLAKPEGKYNLILEEVPIPEPAANEVRVKAVRSLISRGSEMGARYTREHAVSPNIMGYSMAGTIDAVGSDFEMKTGFCGKGGQSVPVGTGQGHVGISELTVGGTEVA